MKNNKNTQIENKFIAITTMLVCLLAFPTAHSLFFDIVTNDKSISASVVGSSGRGIASVESADKETPVHYLRPTVFELNCTKSVSETLQVQATHLRLKGISCNLGLEGSVTNTSNGFKASVFKDGVDKFSTDYIDLSKGKNEIKIIIDSGGKSVEKLFYVDRTE